MHGAELRKFRKEREIRCAVCTELFTAVDARLSIAQTNAGRELNTRELRAQILT